MVAANGVMARYAAERRCLGKSAASSKRRSGWQRIVKSRRPLRRQTPADPIPAPSIHFCKTQAPTPVHFADVSLAVIKLMGPGEYAVSHPTPGDKGKDQSHFALAAHDYTHSTAPRRFADTRNPAPNQIGARARVVPSPTANSTRLPKNARKGGRPRAKVERVMQKRNRPR